MNDIFKLQIQGAGIQVMESAYIIATSKNIDTIKSRYGFLEEKVETLKDGKTNPNYKACIEGAIDRYKAMYYDRVPQDYQLNILLMPDEYDLIEFYCISLTNAMKRFYTFETEKINLLKRESAKAKKKLKLIEVVEIYKKELQAKCSSASSYTNSLREFELIQK